MDSFSQEKNRIHVCNNKSPFFDDKEIVFASSSVLARGGLRKYIVEHLLWTRTPKLIAVYILINFSRFVCHEYILILLKHIISTIFHLVIMNKMEWTENELIDENIAFALQFFANNKCRNKWIIYISDGSWQLELNCIFYSRSSFADMFDWLN